MRYGEVVYDEVVNDEVVHVIEGEVWGEVKYEELLDVIC